MFDNLREDLRRPTRYHRTGAHQARRLALLGGFLSPGLQAIAVYRFGHWANRAAKPLRLLAWLPYQLAAAFVRIFWGIAIDRDARIGSGLYIAHFGGITISGAATIGRNVVVSQGVTIGMSDGGVPVIGDDVYIGAGAKLFGKIRVGNNVKIGANAVIHKDLPDNAVAVLAPGFSIISMRGNRRIDEAPKGERSAAA